MKDFEFIEQTVLIIKPDAVNNGYSGKIIKNIEDAGFFVKAIKILKLDLKQAEELYIEHRKKTFYNNLIENITDGCVFILLVEGKGAVDRIKKFVGNTDPKKAASKTLRAIYGENTLKNAVHCSDSIFSSIREISIFFNEEFICEEAA